MSDLLLPALASASSGQTVVSEVCLPWTGSSSVAHTTALAPCADLTAATFDGSAAYLAIGGAQVQIYNIVKGKFPELAQLSDTQKVGWHICFMVE